MYQEFVYQVLAFVRWPILLYIKPSDKNDNEHELRYRIRKEGGWFAFRAEGH